MSVQSVPIGLGRLLCPDLTPSTKLVWLALRLDRNMKKEKLRSPTRIHRRIGTSRMTIRTALARLDGPYHPQVPEGLVWLSRLQVRVRADLITDKDLPAMARVLYCVLLGLHQRKKLKGLSTYTSIAGLLQVQPRTIRRAVQALVQAGWLGIKRVPKRGPIRFSFPDRDAARRRAELRRAEQRLEKSKHHGEALCLLWCDALVDSTHHRDDYYPQFLTNPQTNELLQADRYYVDHKVVIEFNGPQHDGPTRLYSEREAKAQMSRDQMKQEICRMNGVPLVVVRPEDLTFQRMRQMLGQVLPLRGVTAEEPIIQYLEMRSRSYRTSIEEIRRESGQVS